MSILYPELTGYKTLDIVTFKYCVLLFLCDKSLCLVAARRVAGTNIF